MGDLKRLKATSNRMETWDDINGFKGVSCLLNIPYFDSVFGYTADYMHHCLAGMGWKFVELFFYSTQDKEYCLAKYIIDLDTQFQSVTLFQSMTRAPKSISYRASCTCIEYRTFLLFLCLPSLKDILAEFERFRNQPLHSFESFYNASRV